MSKVKFTYRKYDTVALKWWGTLTIDQKVDYKKRFEVYRNSDEVKKSNYPNMYDMRDMRLSQLGNKHIDRIWVFRERI